jgi:hypothetical protein
MMIWPVTIIDYESDALGLLFVLRLGLYRNEAGQLYWFRCKRLEVENGWGYSLLLGVVRILFGGVYRA